MGRMKSTARKSTGGAAPRRQLATRPARKDDDKAIGTDLELALAEKEKLEEDIRGKKEEVPTIQEVVLSDDETPEEEEIPEEEETPEEEEEETLPKRTTRSTRSSAVGKDP